MLSYGYDAVGNRRSHGIGVRVDFRGLPDMLLV